jgi:myosin heavy subunit
LSPFDAFELIFHRYDNIAMASFAALYPELENTTSRVWVSQVKDVWEPAEVLNRTPNTAELIISRTVKHSDVGQGLNNLIRATVDLSKVTIVPRNPAALEGTNDLVTLQFLDEPNIMHNLEIRYEAEKIYTSTGPILIAINPWKELNIYGYDFMEKYKDHGMQHESEKLPPHVYAVADSAYRDMLRTGKPR